MKKQENRFQKKEWVKTPEKGLYETNKWFFWTKWKLQQRGRNYKKIPNSLWLLKTTVTALKNTIELFNSRLHEAKEKISELIE